MLFLPDSVFRCKFAEVAFDVYYCGFGLPFQKPIRLLRVSSVILSFQTSFLVLLGCILRRCLFQVVSVRGALKLRLI